MKRERENKVTIQNIILGSLKKNVFVSVREGICAQECKYPQRPKKEGVGSSRTGATGR